jgi:hypothetical protein
MAAEAQLIVERATLRWLAKHHPDWCIASREILPKGQLLIGLSGLLEDLTIPHMFSLERANGEYPFMNWVRSLMRQTGFDSLINNDILAPCSSWRIRVGQSRLIRKVSSPV